MDTMRAQVRRSALIMGVGLLLLLGAGCSPAGLFGDDDADDEQPTETDGAIDPVEDEDGEAAEDDVDEPDEPVEEADEPSDAADADAPSGPGSLDAEPLASLTNATGAVLSITRLDRVGDVVVLGYDIDNRDGDEPVVTRFIWARESGFRGNDLDQPYLLDEANLVRYRVLRDEDGECLCTRLAIGGEVAVGEAMSFNSGHPAPPSDVTSVSVVFPGFPPFPDIPIADS